MALKRLSLVEGDDFLKKALPANVRASVDAEQPHTDDKVVARIHSWLSGAGQHELTRCSTAHAAIAAAAPVALLSTQLTDARDAALEKVASRRLHKQRVEQRIHRTGFADAVWAALPRVRGEACKVLPVLATEHGAYLRASVEYVTVGGRSR